MGRVGRWLGLWSIFTVVSTVIGALLIDDGPSVLDRLAGQAMFGLFFATGMEWWFHRQERRADT
jgi:hypothetical protein